MDPLSPISNLWLGHAFFYARRYEQAIEQPQETIEMHPNHAPAYISLGWAYWHGRMKEEAIAAFQKAINLSGGSDPAARAAIACAYAFSGSRDEALNLLDELVELEKQQCVSPLNLAFIYVGLDEKREAFQWLEKAYQVRDGNMGFFQVIPFPHSIRDVLVKDPDC